MQDAGHLVRLAVAFLVGIIAFAAARGFLVPPSFGQYGHYRGDAVKEAAARAPVHAGQAACADCHSDIVEQKTAGKHRGVSCEGCHGPLATHAADPAALKPSKPDSAVLCARCHEADAAKPEKFPQVVSKEHSAGMACAECHQPHKPEMSGGDK
jgi:hypothetical protein